MHVDIVIPVHNEANALNLNVPRLHEHLRTGFPYRWRILIADHGSTDGSFWVARKLEEKYHGVVAWQIALEGRGRALKRASQGLGDVFCLLGGARLPPDLTDIAKLVKPVAEGACDIAVGRCDATGLASGLYRLGLKLLVDLPVTGGPLKAVNRRVAAELIPLVRDEFWFFDTELLALAQSKNFRLQQVAISSERSDNLLQEPLPDLLRRILDLRRRLRETSRVNEKPKIAS